MSKKLVISGFIVLLLLIAASTKPSKEDYVQYISNQVKEDKGWFVGAISSPIVRGLSSEKDLVVFSIFETNFSEDEKMISLGVFNKVFTIYTSQESS